MTPYTSGSLKLYLTGRPEFLGLPPELGTPKPDQLQGSGAEKIIETAGRTCYDSFGKGRNSVAYHHHIVEDCFAGCCRSTRERSDAVIRKLDDRASPDIIWRCQTNQLNLSLLGQLPTSYPSTRSILGRASITNRAISRRDMMHSFLPPHVSP